MISNELSLPSPQHNIEGIFLKKGVVTVTIDNLTIALVVASILYSFCLILSYRKLVGLHRIRPHLSTKSLLLMSVAVVCAVRIMTILGVASMNIANVRAHYSLQPIDRQHSSTTAGTASSTGYDRNQAFYDKSMTVLFDLPNCVVVSTYVLLTLVWAECFLESRFHTESISHWKNAWLQLYMWFNSVLYGCQLVLYCSIFLATDSIVRTVLYAGITGINFVAVSMVTTLYLYLNVRFSGFPYRSQHSRDSLHKISSVMTLWSVTRIIWGVATLCVFLFNIELLQDSNTPFWSFVVLLLLFFVCEIVPIIAMLDYSYMNMIGMTEANDTFEWMHDHILTSPLLVEFPSDQPLESNDEEDNGATTLQ
ncbi:hypothetical protein MHU86_14859 [Fragilaria crotonensis]|nr:hypothetical protein MHU86_14859 [Fragilaria crotonensis]